MYSEDLFQRLTVGATFNRTLNIFSKRYDLFLLISLVVFLPLVIMSVTLFGYIGSSFHTFIDTLDVSNRYLQRSYSGFDDDDRIDPVAFQDFTNQLFVNAGVMTGQLFVEMLFFYIFAIAADAAVIYAVGQMYIKGNPNFLECFKKGFSKWCTLFGASMLVSLGFHIVYSVLQWIFTMYLSNALITLMMFVVIVALLVFQIYVFVCMIILSPAIVIENLGPIDGIKRTWELAQNNRCYIFCTLFCFGFIYNISILIISGTIANFVGNDAVFSPWGIFVSMLPTIIYLPLNYILKAVVYLNIRVQQEGMNYDVLTDDLDRIFAKEEMTIDVNEDTPKFEPLMESKGHVI